MSRANRSRRPTMFVKGETYYALSDVVDDIHAGHYIYVRDRLVSASWLVGWSLSTIIARCGRGELSRAELRD